MKERMIKECTTTKTTEDNREPSPRDANETDGRKSDGQAAFCLILIQPKTRCSLALASDRVVVGSIEDPSGEITRDTCRTLSKRSGARSLTWTLALMEPDNIVEWVGG
jgi:hypothetical protein